MNSTALSYSSFESITSLSISEEKVSLMMRSVRSSYSKSMPGVFTVSFFLFIDSQSFMR